MTSQIAERFQKVKKKDTSFFLLNLVKKMFLNGPQKSPISVDSLKCSRQVQTLNVIFWSRNQTIMHNRGPVEVHTFHIEKT